MSQIITSVGCLKNGSMNAVLGSGIISMSLSLIACQPRIEEPSKPMPSSKVPSSISPIGYEQCCQMPGQSVNRRSTISTLFFLAYSSTSFAFIRDSLVFVLLGDIRLMARRAGFVPASGGW